MKDELRTAVLIDNLAPAHLQCEWGLSFYIEFHGQAFLLDMGTSGEFAANAEKLGIDLAGVGISVLSHAHYDHGDGMEAFFARNDRAKLYISRNAGENCYGLNDEGQLHYIGLKPGLLEKYKDRIVRAGGLTELAPGAYLLGHSTPGLEEIGRRVGMKIRIDRPCGKDIPGKEADDGRPEYVTDCFAHEQSLVFRTEQGLVVFNSCSHAGPGNIIEEVLAAFPGEHIRAYLGGLHQFRSTQEEVRNLARMLRTKEVDRIYTGHCTGDDAYRILREELGDRIVQFESGYEIVI